MYNLERHQEKPENTSIFEDVRKYVSKFYNGSLWTFYW